MVISDIVVPYIWRRNSKYHIFFKTDGKNGQQRTEKEPKKFADISTFFSGNFPSDI
jgi:hypothetical protein